MDYLWYILLFLWKCHLSFLCFLFQFYSLIFFLYNLLYYIIRRYCVIIYFGQFWPPDFCPIYVIYLLYRPLCLFLSSVVSVIYVVGSRRLSLLIIQWQLAQCADGGGGLVVKTFLWVCAPKLFWRAIYCAKPSTNIESHSDSWSHGGLVRQAPHIMQEWDCATTIMICPLINDICVKWVPQVFPPWVD